MLLELERRLHQVAGLALGQDGAAGQGLPVVLVEHRLVVERVHVRHAAVHHQEDDALGSRLEVQPGQHAALAAGWYVRRRGRLRQRRVQHLRQRDEAEAAAQARQRLASGHGHELVIAGHSSPSR